VQRALKSVFEQDFRDFEVIVIDDGSTDGTFELLRHNPLCTVVRTERVGPAAARNAGISVARGLLIAFLDSDDIWLPTHLSSLVPAFEDEAVGLAYSPTKTVRLDGLPLSGRRDRRRCYSGRVTERLFEHVFVHTSNVVCRRELLEVVGCFEPSLPVCEDYHLWLRLSLRCHFKCVYSTTALRCWHENTLSRQDRLRNSIVRALMLERFYRSEGGSEAISQRVAARRLGRVFYQAGRLLADAGQFALGAKFLRRSLRYRPLQVRAALKLLRCSLSRDTADSRQLQEAILRGLACSL